MGKRILTSYYRPKKGGFCKRYFRALSALLQSGNTIHYVAVEPFPLQHDNCYFHQFPWKKEKSETLFFWFFFHLFAPFQLLYIAGKNNVDILFAFSCNYAFLLQPTRFFLKKRLLVFLRGDAITAHKVNSTSKTIIFIETIIERFGLSNAEVYSVSEVCLQRTLSRHPRTKIKSVQLLRNDIPIIINNNKKKDSMGSTLHCSFVGVLSTGKNVLFLLQIFQNLREEDICLHIFGDGPDRERLEEKAIQYGIEGKVLFHGWITDGTLWDGIDLVLFPSLHEGAPNALLEAVAQEKAILASDIPEHREIVNKNLLLPFEESEWVKMVKEIYYSKEVLDSNKNMVKETLKFLSFDWDKKIVDITVGGSKRV